MRRSIFISLVLLLTVTAAAHDDKNFSYMFTRDGNSIVSGNIDLQRIEETTRRFRGAYLWAKRDGRQYLIRDAATLAEAQAAFVEADALHAEYERLHARMRPIEKREQQLERQIDDLQDNDRSVPAELVQQLKSVQRQLRALEDEEERIDEQEEKIVEAAEKKLREIVDQAIRRGVAETIR